MFRRILLLAQILTTVAAWSPAAKGQADTVNDAGDAGLESLFDYQTDEASGAELLEQIEDIAAEPIDLNKAKAGELSALIFLAPDELRRIAQARRAVGRFVSWEQVQALSGIDDRRMEILRRTAVLSQPGRAPAAAKQPAPQAFSLTLRSRLQRDYPLKKGFRSGAYAGPPEKLYNRISAGYGRLFRAEILAARDPGETSPADRLRFALTTERLWMLDRAILGDFTVSFGQGVLLWRPSGFSKGADINAALRGESMGITRSMSASGADLRGAAARASMGGVSLTAFAGRRALDGTVDSVSGMLLSIDESDLHRSASELQKRDAAVEDVAGMRAGFSAETGGVGISAGLSGYACRFSRRLNARSPWDFGGDRASAAGVDFSAAGGNWSASCEIGRLRGGRTGIAAAFTASLAEALRSTFGFRMFPADFAGIHGYAFGEANGRTQNEHGIYSGLVWRISRTTTLRAYFDLFRFPAPTYYVDVPSSGSERFAELSWKATRGTELSIRIKDESKDGAVSHVDEYARASRPVDRLRSTSVRLEACCDITPAARFRVRVEHKSSAYPYGLPGGKGFLLLSDLRLSPAKWIRIDGRAAFCDTDSWDSRIYAYEQDMPGVFSVTPLYGNNLRLYILLRISPARFCDLALKVSRAIRYGATAMGSGNDAVSGDETTRLSAGIDFKL